MLYSQQNQVLFTHVSRTGGVTVANSLHELLPDLRPLLVQHAPLAAARPVLGAHFDPAFKFAFVRNPWERFVSWYALLGKASLPDEQLADPTSSHWRGFDSFLESWAAQETEIDGVTRRNLSQWAQLTDADGNLLTDMLGRFETLSADIRRIFAAAGLPDRPLPQLNASSHHHYSLYYSDFGRELVEKTFPEDITLLGYQFESPAKPDNG